MVGNGENRGRLGVLCPGPQRPIQFSAAGVACSLLFTIGLGWWVRGGFGLWACPPCPTGLRGPRIASSGESQAEAHHLSANHAVRRPGVHTFLSADCACAVYGGCWGGGGRHVKLREFTNAPQT